MKTHFLTDGSAVAQTYSNRQAAILRPIEEMVVAIAGYLA